MDPQAAADLVASLQEATDLVHFEARDILRASGRQLLAADHKHVASDLSQADGYHRVCAQLPPGRKR
jgi:hypothetical protein